MVEKNEKTELYIKLEKPELLQSNNHHLLNNNIYIELNNLSKDKTKLFQTKNIKKGKWSEHEDKLLKKWVKTYGPKNWEACGQFIQGRTGKQCREHWNNCLNPQLIKGDWTPEEDFLIIFFYQKCNGSWNKIITLFNGRIENSIKNRFYTQLRKCATKNMIPRERKNIKMKMRLDELKNYINEALIEAKANLLKKSKMTEKQFNLFIEKNEQKLKDSLDIKLENCEPNSSINLDVSNTKEDLDETFINKKRIRIENDKNINNNINNNINMNSNHFLFDYKFDKRRYEFGSKYLNDNIIKFLKNHSFVYNYSNFYINNK